MTEAEPIEIEDEDENPMEPSDDKPEVESSEKNSPIAKSRVVKPQVIRTLPDLLKAIGLSL